MSNIKCVIFDLDGTLLDTLEDMHDSINRVLKTHNLEQKSLDFVRCAVGNGYKVFVDKCVNTDNIELKKEILNEYSIDYTNNCDIKTKPYEGIIPLLKKLKSNNIKIAIVSNKGDKAVNELNSKYFDGLFDYVFGIKDGILPKPNPDLIYSIIESSNIDKDNIIYVGDSDVDINTANNAGIKCISVSWGFRTKRFLELNGAKTIIDTPNELLNHL